MCRNYKNFQMTEKYHELNQKLKIIKRLEQAKQTAHYDFKRLQNKNSAMKFENQRAQTNGNYHAPNISSGFKMDNFYNICFKYFCYIKLYFVI